VLLSYSDGAGHDGPIISSDFCDDGWELIGNSKTTQPQPQTRTSSSLSSPSSSALLSYGDGAEHVGPVMSTDFRDERSELRLV